MAELYFLPPPPLDSVSALKSQNATILLGDLRSSTATAMNSINGKHHQMKPGGGAGVCLCRCICCCCCFLFLFISILITILFYSHPKIPIYKIQSIKVKALKFSPDYGLTTDFLVAVRTQNPNKNIELLYGKGGWVGIEYSGVTICRGEIPAFKHGGESSTSFKVELKGKSALGEELVKAFINQQSSRRIPAMVKLKLPVGVAVGKMGVRKLNVFVNFSLVFDGLSPDIAAGIVSTQTVFRIQIL